MKIILSPAKKMITDTDSIAPDGLPEFIEKTTEIQSWLKSKSKEELKTIWKCNDKITNRTSIDWKTWIFIIYLPQLSYHMKELLFNIWLHPCLRTVSSSMYKII